MSSLNDWLTLVNLFFGGTATGALLFELLVLVPSMNRQPTETSALIHRLVLGELDLPMRVLPPSSILCGLSGLVILLTKSHQSTTFTVLYLVAVVAMAIMGISTATLSHPINIAISKWPIESLQSIETVPSEYPAMRRRWDRVMVMRSALGVGAFICFLIANINAS